MGHTHVGEGQLGRASTPVGMGQSWASTPVGVGQSKASTPVGVGHLRASTPVGVGQAVKGQHPYGSGTVGQSGASTPVGLREAEHPENLTF